MMFDMPSAQNQFLSDHVKLMLSSYRKFVGKDLFDEDNLPNPLNSLAEFIFRGPFVLLSHGIESSPIFNYANQQALALFEMDWPEFTSLPSKYSAEAESQEAREALLKQAARCGFIDNYKGVRISRSGRRFFINKVQLWNLVDDQGNAKGQAAYFTSWEFI